MSSTLNRLSLITLITIGLVGSSGRYGWCDELIPPKMTGLIAPKWSDYCRDYETCNQTLDKDPSVIGSVVNGLLIVSVVGAPLGIIRTVKAQKKYISNRNAIERADFENNLYNCQQMSSNDLIAMCYMKMREIWELKGIRQDVRGLSVSQSASRAKMNWDNVNK